MIRKLILLVLFGFMSFVANAKTIELQEKSMRQIFVLHGYSASIDDHWFLDLKHQIEDEHTTVTLIPFPDSENPDVNAWQKVLDQQVPKVDENTYFVAHSLGVITLLHFLQRHDYQKIGGMILVSGFSGPISDFSPLDAYITKSKVNTDYFKDIKKKLVYLSDNDDLVPPKLTIELAKEIDAPYITVPNGGHFLGREGYTSFPQVVNSLKEMLDSK
ncbi:alpha/beta hydrolase [Acinetobacter pittii]|jgi:predicted alpha/beta hydrolase family esterase|uniref:RBBP9/YdeN family alpha/beta hydrolase n=1 Tax=Acinetobacter calcoaceticus/baumannii complex TaxID=909768 RepID=UPI00045343A4|nr:MULTISPECIES: alpha/beta hydrolase [Acinetobacter calcoaceticus/baumannii complex]EXC26415.1 serine hydrolase family protein [Acinetobacter sp. 809848]EXR38544.1 serine hydrolase family protein [Acinetobacter sp. 1294243]MCK0878551.1 alpha/beta hydrolase [Acinetobacter pittii]MEB6625263.1 alpha/beta hydrolase [Acinetobacter pittii]OCY17109.1 signal peptide-containing protein [Acinetobacter pittii]